MLSNLCAFNGSMGNYDIDDKGRNAINCKSDQCHLNLATSTAVPFKAGHNLDDDGKRMQTMRIGTKILFHWSSATPATHVYKIIIVES